MLYYIQNKISYFLYSMRNISLLLFLISAFISSPAFTFADGGFFVGEPYIDIGNPLTEPGQQAVLLFESGKEQLIIQAKSSGDVPDFAWVIPVPAYPEIKEADADIFSELNLISRANYIETLKIFPWSFWNILIQSGFVISGTLENVQLHESKKIGIFDVSLLGASDGNSLLQWLENNNYHIPVNAVQILDEYIKNNWYFVAFKVNELNIPAIKALHDSVDSRIVSVTSAHDIITQTILDYVSGESVDIQKLFDFNFSHVSTDAYNYRSSGSLSLFDADFFEEITVFKSNQRRYAEEYILGRPSYGMCPNYNEGSCIHIHGLSFLDFDNITQTDLKNNLDITHNDEEEWRNIGIAIKKRIVDDLLQNKPYEQTFVYTMLSKGLIDQQSDDVKKAYDTIIEDYTSPEGQLRKHMSDSLRFNFFQPLNIDSEQSRLLTPVSLSFNTTEPIFPLKISSINSGSTEVVLYALSSEYLTTDMLNLEYANIFDVSKMDPSFSAIFKAFPKATHLTKLRNNVEATEMNADIILRTNKNQLPYRLNVFEDGFVSWFGWLTLSCVMFYMWGLLISLLVQKMINRVARKKFYIAVYGKTALYGYPLIGVFLLILLAISNVFALDIVNFIGLLFFFTHVFPPIVMIMSLYVFLHLIFSVFIRNK